MKREIFKLDIHDLISTIEFDFQGQNAFIQALDKADELTTKAKDSIGLVWSFEKMKIGGSRELEAIVYRGIVFFAEDKRSLINENSEIETW